MGRGDNPIKRAIASSAVLLAKVGLIDEHRGRRTADLAWPRIVTGLTRTSRRTFDVAMVGIAVGPAAIAGMGFAFTYWVVVNGLGFSLANGAMTLLSQRYGADDYDGFDRAFKQTLWVELLMAGFFVALFVGFATPLIEILGAAPESARHGSTYLMLTGIALLFELPNKIWSRALVSANDAWTPMVVRAGGATINIILNAILIFGFGLGVFGAGVGTIAASAVTSLTLAIGFIYGGLPKIGQFPVRLRVGPPYFDLGLMKQLLEIALPLMGNRLISRLARFPMLVIVAQFGTIVVAAYTVGRRVRGLLNAPAWGFGSAARSLVGQELGTGDELEAEAYGRDILRFGLVVFIFTSIGAFLFAGYIAPLFTTDPETIQQAIPFIQVVALSLLGRGVESPTSGTISAAGDTRWPFYARLIGLYAFMLPIAYLGVASPLGIIGIYLALGAETVVPGLIIYWRFRSGKWKVVSRKYRPAATD